MNTRGSSRNGTQSLQLLAACLGLTLCAAACGSGADECISLPESCSPTLSTDYNTIYASVLSTSCGTATGVMTCHGAAGNQGGLSLAEPNGAYSALLSGAPHARVVPGDPACSPLMARLTSGDPNVRMPKGGAPLGEGVLCAIQSWIREGASR
jgi:hypothetical protein